METSTAEQRTSTSNADVYERFGSISADDLAAPRATTEHDREFCTLPTRALLRAGVVARTGGAI